MRALLAAGVLAAGSLAFATAAAASETAAAAEAETDCLYQGFAGDGRPLCIRKDRFNEDLCAVIDHVAAINDLPQAFFARLIWRESRFRPEAISHKGAEGIAQFMPGTARLRNLSNSFNAVEALSASSAYLDELRRRFGNLGFAAAAYNAGEGGLSRFLATGRLPLETRDYVFAITGHLAETWRDNPPAVAAPALQEDAPFIDACVTLAKTRRLDEPVLTGSADWAPWGVQLAGHYNPTIAMRLFNVAVARLPAPLDGERALVVRQRGGNFGHRPRYAARIGRATRAEAEGLCENIRAAGGTCTVLRNR